MGSGIAHVAALAGYQVMLSDIGQTELDAALETIRTNLGRQARRGAITDEQQAAALGRIAPAVGLDGIKDVDLVIEAVVEDEAVKKEIFVALRGALPEHTIICTNSSSLSVTRLAASTDRPGKFMGMHFMNPVPMMELVELVRGIATEEGTYEIARKVTERMGKIPAMAEDFPAFIVNRILMPMVNEAIYALYEGVGTVKAIDTAMKLGAHHRMGPLELADFIGLDTCHSIMQVLYEGLADSKYRPCPLLAKYVEAGWLGLKTGKGFYDYSTGTPVPDALSCPPGRSPAVVGVAGEDAGRTPELLRQHRANEQMRPRHRPKRKNQVGTREGRGPMPVGAPDQETPRRPRHRRGCARAARRTPRW